MAVRALRDSGHFISKWARGSLQNGKGAQACPRSRPWAAGPRESRREVGSGCWAELPVSSRADMCALGVESEAGRSWEWGEFALAECREGGRRFSASQTQTTGGLWGIQLPQDNPTPRMSPPLGALFRVP